uniref:Ig-like domain-containing protein n=1 Tax=Oncorhynchus tshawytscha TaxID=74940 RepID=A0AAZ3S9R9_ONCTS
PDSEQELTPYTDVEVASERDRVTLFCNYTSSGVTLLWYRQHPKSAPQLLVMEYADITPGFTLNHDKNAKRTDLKISSAEVTDSAKYYCALMPTVTGNPETLFQKIGTEMAPHQTGSLPTSLERQYCAVPKSPYCCSIILFFKLN